MNSKTLILLAHPDLRHSRVNHHLQQVALQARQQARAADGSPCIELRDLYALYPDFALDIEAEQAAVAWADRLVWLHPVQWYGMPALLKLWLDEVFSSGWAHGPGGRALTGKALWLVASTSTAAGPDAARGVFLPPYEQVAATCGLHWQPPLLWQGTTGPLEPALQAHGERFQAGLLGPAARPTHPPGPRA